MLDRASFFHHRHIEFRARLHQIGVEISIVHLLVDGGDRRDQSADGRRAQLPVAIVRGDDDDGSARSHRRVNVVPVFKAHALFKLLDAQTAAAKYLPKDKGEVFVAVAQDAPVLLFADLIF